MPKCVNCGRELGEFELKSPGSLLGNKRALNIASNAAQKCTQCGAWICCMCQIAAMSARRDGDLRHRCGGVFESQD